MKPLSLKPPANPQRKKRQGKVCRNDDQPVLDPNAWDATGRLCEACFWAFVGKHFRA